MNISALKPKPFLKLTSLAMLFIICQGAMLSGCSSHSALMVKQVEQQTDDQKVIQQVMDALQVTEARIAKAQADNVELFAPNQMAEATSALNEARRYSQRFQADPQNVNKSISLFFGDTMGEKALALISQANTALTKAEDNKKQADVIFSQANENFIWLKKFQAPTHFRYEYQDLEDTQKRLVGYVASGDSDKAKQALPGLLQEQRALETAAAQRFYLFDLDQKVKWKGQSTLDRYASLSYSTSLGALNKAKAVIAQNSRDEAAILLAKAEADFSLEIATAMAADMQNLMNMDRKDMERWLILLTTKLNTIANTLGFSDVRNHELMQQLDLLAASAKQNDQPDQITDQVANAKPEVKKVEHVVSSKVDAPKNEPAINQRITQLEKTLEQQVKALSDQLNAMKAANKSAQATTKLENSSAQ